MGSTSYSESYTLLMTSTISINFSLPPWKGGRNNMFYLTYVRKKSVDIFLMYKRCLILFVSNLKQVGKACDDMYVSNQCHFEEIKAVSRGF
jgi:hypothetical protein